MSTLSGCISQRAVVFSFDEKTQCQALDRLPMKPGRAGTMTHDYKRNGTTDLFDVATGEELPEHHTGSTPVLQASPPRRPIDIHVVLDNLSAHSPEVTDWLAHPKRGRWHLHFTPTSSSWLNIIERWFKELTDRRLRRGVFTSVADLIDAIEIWAEHWNHDPEPFIWHKTAEEIITKVRRGRAALHQIKSATHH